MASAASAGIPPRSSALIGAIRLGPGDITNIAVAALPFRMRVWSGAAPIPDV